MKKAFTMIELVFIIVIIGILSAVAIPRMTGTADQARMSKIKAFMGTLNRSVGPILWANHLEENGSVKAVSYTEFLNAYTELPKGVINIDLSQCADTNMSTGNKVGDITVDALPVAESIYCIDGSGSTPPKFAFSPDMNRSLQNN